METNNFSLLKKLPPSYNIDLNKPYIVIRDALDDTTYQDLEDSFPLELKVTARTDNNLIMALEHIEYPIFGVQFHPESIVTEHGQKMINNFLEI